MLTLGTLNFFVTETDSKYLCFRFRTRAPFPGQYKAALAYIFCNKKTIEKGLRAHPSNISLAKVISKSIEKVFCEVPISTPVSIDNFYVPGFIKKEEFFCDDPSEYDMYFELNGYTPIKYER